jgi:sigma-B regulation protein RsbU (phosphoserine phosphatase)
MSRGVRRSCTAERIELFAPPLGVRLPFSITERSCELASGDVIVLHSDGVYESRNEQGEIYGLERLEKTIADQPQDTSADALRDAIVRDVQAFRGNAAQEDDVTVVVPRLRA